jgi:hypothetical protein
MMKGTVRELALVPREGGGPLSRFVARTAARLRLAEAPGVLPPDGVEGCLATAQRMLADGHLAEAAALMVRTTAAAAREPVPRLSVSATVISALAGQASPWGPKHGSTQAQSAVKTWLYPSPISC